MTQPSRFVRFAPAVATALLLPGLLALGFWQLDRSRQKLEIRNQVEQAAGANAISIATDALDSRAVKYRAVQSRGAFEPVPALLLDNKIYRGEAGYHVVAPFRPAGSDIRVLVNLGWVPWGPDRSVLPATPTPQGVLQIQGRAVIPPQDYFELKAQTPELQTRVWQNLDLAKYRTTVDFDVQPFVVELATESPVSDYKRQWRDFDDGWVERHKGYAFQWFGLAATLVVINIALWRRRRKTSVSRRGS